MITPVNPLPDDHLFASMIHERSRIASGGRTLMLDRREGGVSHVTRSRDGLIVSTDDRLPGAIHPIARDLVHWLENTEAPAPPVSTGALRCIERRVWILAGGRESRMTQRFFVVPGIGITTPDAQPPRRSSGHLVRGDEPIVFRNGSSATLMHELAGHRSEAAAQPADWPEWLSIVDDPRITPWASCTPDDTGGFPGAADLKSSPPASWRRFRVIDSPQPRMSTVVVSCSSGSPWDPPPLRVEVDLVGQGSYDATTDRVGFTIFSGSLISREGTVPLQVPQHLEIHATELIGRVAGGRGAPREAPGVICGSHGTELPVGSIGCELLLSGA